MGLGLIIHVCISFIKNLIALDHNTCRNCHISLKEKCIQTLDNTSSLRYYAYGCVLLKINFQISLTQYNSILHTHINYMLTMNIKECLFLQPICYSCV